MVTAERTVSPEGQNALFTALANHRRRFTLYACNGADGGSTLSDVAEQVAAWEYGKDIAEVTSEERKRVYTSLQQHHLSKLEDAGLIEFDGDTIHLTEKAENVDVYLEIVTDDTIPWSLYYVGMSIIAAAALGLVALEMLPAWVTPSLMGFVIVLTFAVSGIAHYVDTRRKHLDDGELWSELDE